MPCIAQTRRVGLLGRTLVAGDKSRLEGEFDHGVLITGTIPAYAKACKLVADDVVVRFNDSEVVDENDFYSFVHADSSDTVSNVTVWREGEEQSFQTQILFDYAETISHLKQLAAEESVWAQCGLAQTAIDFPQEFSAAERTQISAWLQRAAENDHLHSSHLLGLCYLKGLGVELNPKTASRWFRKAAYRGYPPSMVQLGAIYSNGLTGRKNDAQAFVWNRKAADLGDIGSMNYLEWAFQFGAGVH